MGVAVVGPLTRLAARLHLDCRVLIEFGPLCLITL